MFSSRTLTISSELPADADVVWRGLKTPSAFVHVARGMLRYPAAEGLNRPWQTGDEIRGWVFLFGVIPFSRHRLRIEAVGDDERELQSDEGGGLVRSWRHLVRVTPIDDGRCRYHDIIEIDAGRLTPLVCAFAYVSFRYRQRRWRRLARLLSTYAAAGSQQI